MPNTTAGGPSLSHDYAFDPSYGYSLPQLLAVEPPPGPPDFAEFWRARHARALQIAPGARLTETGRKLGPWRVLDLHYHSTDSVEISGWALVPDRAAAPTRGFVVGHGYGGRSGPDIPPPFPDAVLLFPCARGLGRSTRPDIPAEPRRHVVHHIADRDRYVLAGCVDDLWLAVSALLELFPSTIGAVGVLGVSFSGGITLLATPWDARITRAHVEVPTFGHQPLRLALPTTGSGAGVQAYASTHAAELAQTLPYFDAAVAARHVRVPVQCACACFDPAVAPPGQFAIYNALPPALRRLVILAAGHHGFTGLAAQEAALREKIYTFFA